MKILFTGSKGQLGYQIARVFEGNELLGTDREENVKSNSNDKSNPNDKIQYAKMDITDKEEVIRVVGEFKPDVIIHGAAYTNVDGAETDREAAFLVNEAGTKNITEVAETVGAKVVYVSTDYVFSGDKTEEYQESDETGPQSVYGESKLAGEKAVQELDNHLICRTAWLYGENGKNFVETMLALAGGQELGAGSGGGEKEIRVVNDQVGSPTYAYDLAQAIKFLIEKDAKGIFHTVNAGNCSWFDFASKIFELSGKKIQVSPVSTAEFPRPAKRPAHSVLSTKKLAEAGFQMKSWEDALQEYLKSR